MSRKEQWIIRAVVLLLVIPWFMCMIGLTVGAWEQAEYVYTYETFFSNMGDWGWFLLTVSLDILTAALFVGAWFVNRFI